MTIGAPVRRVEDRRFLTGTGRFLGDIHFVGELHGVFVRSPHAHARIVRIDTSAAAKAPGIAAIYTGADMAADNIAAMKPMWSITAPDGSKMAEPPRYALSRDRVRHVGEPVAFVVANTLAQAMDAAERVVVDYEPLPSITEGAHAQDKDAPLLHQEAPGNVCFRFGRGDKAKVDSGFAKAAHVVAIDLHNQRIAGVALEPRGAIALPASGPDKLTLYSTTQTPHHIRRQVAEQLGLSEAKLRVISPDVGGGFGFKGKLYPEESVLPWAATKLNRPIRWMANRNESFNSDLQARDHTTHAELALDEAGKFLALRVRTIANVGAYVSTFGAAIPSVMYSGLLAGVYTTPAITIECVGVFTNTVPTDAYRGAGRPEACFVLERLADRAAEALGVDRAEIRKRNLIPTEAMPYQTPIGPSYDSGDFPRILARVSELADIKGFAARRKASDRKGLRRGLGLACFLESSGVAPSGFAGKLGARVGFYEAAAISMEPDGSVRARFGTHNHGQGHETSFAQILSSQLGVPIEKIEVIEGDTDIVPYGTGTFGSRSIAVGGSALTVASGKIIEKGRAIAAHLLEAAESDITFDHGNFTVAGTNHSVSLEEVARAAYVPHNFPLETLEPGLHADATYDPKTFAFSNGVHVCEVEVDVETGLVNLDRYIAVDDVGIVINPLLASAQVHGGVAQGFGQAVLEHAIYEQGSGQALCGSLMDYALPRAHHFPVFVSEFDQSQPCTHNPLGAKGCGEAGTIAAPAAIVGAVLDALRPLGVTDIGMPLTPARVWQAIASARAV